MTIVIQWLFNEILFAEKLGYWKKPTICRTQNHLNVYSNFKNTLEHFCSWNGFDFLSVCVCVWVHLASVLTPHNGIISKNKPHFDRLTVKTSHTSTFSLINFLIFRPPVTVIIVVVVVIRRSKHTCFDGKISKYLFGNEKFGVVVVVFFPRLRLFVWLKHSMHLRFSVWWTSK